MNIMKFDFTVRNIMIVVGLVVTVLLIIKLQALFTVFAASFFLAYLFDPLINWFEKKHIPRYLSILLLYIVIILAFFLFLGSMVPLIYQESLHLADALPAYLQKLFSIANETMSKFGVDISFDAIQQQLVPKLAGFGHLMLSSSENVVKSVTTVVNTLIYIALIPVITFYFLKDFGAIRDKMFDRFSGAASIDFPKHFMHFNSLLSRYFRGQVMVALFLGVSYTVVLLIAGVKPALLIGMVSGVLSIVPYLGFMIGFFTSLVLSVAQYGDVMHPAMVIIGFGIVQVVESNIVTPKIVGDSLDLHPAAVIFALMAGGSLLGIGGMIIALPVASFIKVVGDGYLDRLKTVNGKQLMKKAEETLKK